MLIRLLDFFINTIFLSIPEEGFVVALTLILMGKTEVLSFKISDVKRFLIPTTTAAAVLSFIRIVLQLDYSFSPFLAIFLVIVMTCFIYRISDIKSILICSGTTILGFLAVGLIQFAYVPVLMSYSGITLEQLNHTGWVLFICSLPERIIEAVILTVIITKNKAVIQINPIKILRSNKAALAVFLTNCVCMLILVYVLTILVYMYDILVRLPAILKLLVPLLVIIIPLFCIGGMIAIIYLLSYREAQKGFTILEETKVLNALANVLSQKGEYRKICSEIDEFESQIKDLPIPGTKRKMKGGK